jgi:hypothetical protein
MLLCPSRSATALICTPASRHATAALPQRVHTDLLDARPNNDQSPAGVASYELLIALSDAVFAIGDEMVRMGI